LPSAERVPVVLRGELAEGKNLSEPRSFTEPVLSDQREAPTASPQSGRSTLPRSTTGTLSAEGRLPSVAYLESLSRTLRGSAQAAQAAQAGQAGQACRAPQNDKCRIYEIAIPKFGLPLIP
ncbi:MAG: hypothetical protein O7E52_13670, partial [Candidatus Poribacteria bacterium]|nr:hypothetical protein [Candidatus Poribacteria bacterium]